MSITRASIIQDIAARIEHQHLHPHNNTRLGYSGYKCDICGKFQQSITKDHARRCGFINKEAMIRAGAVKQFIWGKEVKH